MMTQVMPPDMEAWIIPYLRQALADVNGLEIGNKEPEDYQGGHPLVVVSDVPGSLSSWMLWDWTVAVTVRGWSRRNDKPCKDLARRIMGILADGDRMPFAPGSPICSITEDSTTGPDPVTEDGDIARYYLTVSYTVQGDL